MAIVHLMCGLPCSGKTTFAKKLAEKRKALYLGLDQLLISIHGQYVIESIGHEEHIKRVLSARVAIWKIAENALNSKLEVVLDDGFFLKETRDRYRDMALNFSANTRLYVIQTPLEILKERLEKRNSNLPSDNFYIGVHMLDQMLNMFELPSSEEEPHFVSNIESETRILGL